MTKAAYFAHSTFALAPALIAGQGRLRRRQFGNRHAVGRAGDVAQPDLGAEMNRGRIAAVLAADAEFHVGAGLAAALAGDLYQFADAIGIEADEGVLLDDALALIGLEEAPGIVAAEAIGGL